MLQKSWLPSTTGAEDAVHAAAESRYFLSYLSSSLKNKNNPNPNEIYGGNKTENRVLVIRQSQTLLSWTASQNLSEFSEINGAILET